MAAKKRGPIDELADSIKAAEAPDPQDPQVHYDLGFAYAEMGLIVDAIAELELAAEAGHEGAKLKLRELRGNPPPDGGTLH